MLQEPPEALARTTVYFDHYLFEALHSIGRTDVLLDRLEFWFGLLDQGLRTVIEHPEPRAATATRGAHTRCTTTSRRCSVSGQQLPE
jgi:hypothetical protein